jgi:predicted nucleic acid-binding protein
MKDGPPILNAITFAESAADFRDLESALLLFEGLGLEHEEIPLESAYIAGRAHKLYRQQGGKRERILPDFLIGAHALAKGHRLLTRDATRYRSYFPEVQIIAPDTHP